MGTPPKTAAVSNSLGLLAGKLHSAYLFPEPFGLCSQVSHRAQAAEGCHFIVYPAFDCSLVKL